MNRLAALLLLLAVPAAAQPALPGWTAPAASSAPVMAWRGLELVYSYPVETDLKEPDLREASFVWPEMISQARKSVDVEQFYVAPSTGQPLEATLTALRRAGERGVKIRVLLEKKFEKNSLDGIAILKTIPNLELRIIDWSQVAGAGIVHAKFMVVDGAAAFVGSQNWDWRSLKHIHELGLRVAEPEVVKDVAAVFEHDWAAAAAPEGARVPPTGAIDRSRRAYLVASPKGFTPAGIGDSEAELAALVGEAKTELSIQVMDYNPTTYSRPKRHYAAIDNALRDASVRGLKVRLAVADWSTGEPGLSHLRSLSLLPGVSVKVCTVPESSEGFVPFSRVLHSKYMTVDGTVLWLGTSNWAGGYLDESRNLELVVRDPALAGRAKLIFERVWASPYCAPLELTKDYPKPKR
ncbi:MAG: phospholipase D-like domain-containing protein [Elusimicrobiota bacterium]|nr:phospholipase D-like domain-containing protein [Elusimicrobiota bacterium]